MAWLRGWAIAPIMRSADPRGNSVSESSVMTKRIRGSMDRSPTFTGKLSCSIAQQFVQVHQLAAFALPTHPHPFARVVDPVTMEEEERSRSLAGIFFIELAHQLRTVFDQRVVLGRGFAGIRQIGEQGEVNVGIVVAQKPYFQILHQPAHLFLVEQQAGNGHQRGAVVGNFLREIKLGQNLRFQQRRGQVVHQLDCALRTGQKQNQHREQDEFGRGVSVSQEQHDRRHDGEGEYFGGGQIELIRMPPQERRNPLAQWRLEAHSPVQSSRSFRQEGSSPRAHDAPSSRGLACFSCCADRASARALAATSVSVKSEYSAMFASSPRYRSRLSKSIRE